MIAQYQGLNVKELDALRKVEEKGILLKITKNRITKLALKKLQRKILKNTSLDQQLQQFPLTLYLVQKF